MKRYFTDGSTQWATDGESVVVKSTLSAEWSIAGSTVESLAKCVEVQETDENWQPLAKPEPIDDGGPAFPEGASGPYPNGEIVLGCPGMSLRDWFAGKEKISNDETFSWELCEALAGKRPEKDRVSDPVGWEVWQATWQAKIRFIRADAMLAARKAKP